MVTTAAADLLQLSINYLLLSELSEKFLEGNAKRHDIGAICTSIKRYGFRDPLAIDAALNNGKGGVVEGNGRLEALLRLRQQGEGPPAYIKITESGDWAVPCIIGGNSATEAEGLAYSLDHNSLTMTGGDFTALDISGLYNPAEYLELLERLAQADSLPVTVDGDDLDLLIEMIGNEEPDLEDDEDALADNLDKAAGGEIESRVSLGQIWACGRHRIACGDSTDEGNVRSLLGDRIDEVRVVWADPPYGISIVSANESVGGSKPFGSVGGGNIVPATKYAPIIGDDTIETAIDSSSVALSLFSKAFHVWWGGNYYAQSLPNSNCWIVWDKENTGNFADAELAWTNSDTAVRIFRHMWNGLMKASEKGERRVHPTQKPIALPEWVFGKYGKSDDVIFDPFLGSAPSLIAAQQMPGNRTVYGMELSPEYCEVILRRYEKLTGETAELVGNLTSQSGAVTHSLLHIPQNRLE